MCCRNRKPVDHVHTREEAYEGKTIRLDQSVTQWQPASTTMRCHHFPWWILWFIWPAFFMLKWLIPLIIGSSTAILQTLSVISAPFFALVLIGVGVALLYREHILVARKRHDSDSNETYTDE